MPDAEKPNGQTVTEIKNEARGFLKESALFLLDILYNAVIIIVLVVLIRNFLISPFRVIGSSMADTLESNEFILIDKLSYRLGEPDRGDIIVFRPPITNKYGNKFEEAVTTDDQGHGLLPLEGLKTKKNVIYCQNEMIARLWFCQDSVQASDIVFYNPVGRGDSASENWQNAAQKTVSGEEVKNGQLAIEGKPNQAYMIRIYDTSGPEYFVKRIIGLPGDSVKIENGRVYLKYAGKEEFRELPEPYLNDENHLRTFMGASEKNVFEVPAGQYFVMGDNRNHSNDSRSWFSPVSQDPVPFVAKENISGRVMVILWPFSTIQLMHSPEYALEK